MKTVQELTPGENPPIPKPNLDPISGTPGVHPYGTGIGATTGGIAGTLTGAMLGGPIGAVAGAAIGAIAGGFVGKDIAELFDPTEELEYWRMHHTDRPYHNPEYGFEDYEMAYRFGWESKGRLQPRGWSEVENELEQEWGRYRGSNPMGWEIAREPARDAWDRIK